MKSKTKLSTAILIGSAVIGSTNCEAQIENDSKDNPKIIKDSVDLEKSLKELSETEYKGKLNSGAMCYAVVAKRDTTDFICSVCNKNTRYRIDDINHIKYIKKTFDEIKSLKYDVILDESEYCEHCNKTKLKEPSLIFKIRFSKDADYHVIKSNINEDYLILLDFLKGKDTYIKYEHDIRPIHWKIDVIKKMTGLGNDIITHKHYYVHGDEKAYHENEFKKILKEMGESKERMHWYEQ